METASTIAHTALVQSKIDYYNSLYLSNTVLGRLLLIQNALDRVLANTTRHEMSTQDRTLQSLRWLRRSRPKNESTIKIISVNYDVLATVKPPYLSRQLEAYHSASDR